MTAWYIVKTKPKREKAVKLQLQGAGYEVFLPEMQGQYVPKPLFPSYLFVRADLKVFSQYRLVAFTRGVSHILGDETGPRPIAEEIIRMLKERTQDGSLIEQELLFREGDEVRVRRGWLQELVGMVERHFPDEKRVQVLFKWWSTSMRVRFNYRELERAA